MTAAQRAAALDVENALTLTNQAIAAARNAGLRVALVANPSIIEIERLDLVVEPAPVAS